MKEVDLLGGVMKKAQEIYGKLYNVDIEGQITHSALALKLFRMKYYNQENFPIHIPNKNEDTFLRRAYYGGHVDAYKPYGENLYYYDVNSLYPFVMREFPMPGGDPLWHRNLTDRDLDSLFGFIEAYVICPKTIKKPFLPYRDKDNTLIFPTGEFIGVYYSEELKYARDIGYTIQPISGYLYQKMDSPFKNFVNSLYENRSQAKKDGNEALSYVYKILMNSLYGRFGINPKSTKTELCDFNQYKELLRKSEFIFSEMLAENKYIVAYHINTKNSKNEDWNPPKNSAVQLAAAITASARIYMYPYISREDCYYTDTDSLILSNPLPEEDISPFVIGKFKLECRCSKAYFIATKSYYFIDEKGYPLIKHKGPAKDHIEAEWFQEVYKDPTKKEIVPFEANFRIDWKDLSVKRIKTVVNFGIKHGAKRTPVFKNGQWIDSNPIHRSDLVCIDPYISQKIRDSLKEKIEEQANQIIKLQEKINKLDMLLLEKDRKLIEERKDRDRDTERKGNRDRERTTIERNTLKEDKPVRWTMFPDIMKKDEKEDKKSNKTTDKNEKKIEIEDKIKTKKENEKKIEIESYNEKEHKIKTKKRTFKTKKKDEIDDEKKWGKKPPG